MSSSSLNILVPILPESVVDATVSIWNKKEGDLVLQNEILLEIETDKIMLEVPAPEQGTLETILEKSGSIVISGQILGRLKIHNNITNQNTETLQKNIEENQNYHIQSNIQQQISKTDLKEKKDLNIITSPSVRKLIAEHNVDINNISGSGIKGRVTRQDIEKYIQKNLSKTYNTELSVNKYIHNTQNHNHNYKNVIKHESNRKDTRITMNRLRKTIADRLLNVTNSMAILTTFNEVNMKPLIKLRNKYKELFEQHHNTKLGFTSFYVKAVLQGLRLFPEINASIDGEEIIYRNYFDINIAVSTERGLITPILKDVDTLSIVDIEKKIKFLAEKGRNGKLTIEELSGGNFTITNGGIFGSLMSTPIINPPQSAILGMHVIKERPVALHAEVVILPMMYLALSYDHRLIDGKSAVNFLTMIKELIENPTRLLLDI